MVDAQGINSPGDLIKDALPHRPGHKPKHNGAAVARGVFHNAVDDLQGHEGAFATPAPAGEIINRVGLGLYVCMEREIYGGYVVFYVQGVQDGQRLPLAAFLCIDLPHPLPQPVIIHRFLLPPFPVLSGCR